MKIKGKEYGFTLAEVLITLVVVGVIAAMTIPSVIQKTQERETVVALKKAYTTLSNAVRMAVAEDGSIDTWGLTTTVKEASLEFTEKIKPYLQIAKYCGNGSGCWNPEGSKYLNGNIRGNYDTAITHQRLILSDGKMLDILANSPLCDKKILSTDDNENLYYCGEIKVDINGFKGDNTFGKDIFTFWVAKNGQVLPAGLPDNIEGNDFHFSNCNLNSETPGYAACTAWVLYKENMDYLKGKTISW